MGYSVNDSIDDDGAVRSMRLAQLERQRSMFDRTVALLN